MTESRIARRRKKQGPLPQRILDLMKDADPNEINQGNKVWILQQVILER